MSRLNLSNKRDFRLRKLVWRLALRLDVDPSILEPMVIDAVRVRCLNKVDFQDYTQDPKHREELMVALQAMTTLPPKLLIDGTTSLFGSASAQVRSDAPGYCGSTRVEYKTLEYGDYGTSISHKNDVVPYLDPEMEDRQVAVIHKYMDETVGREPRNEDLVYNVVGMLISKSKPYTPEEREAIRKHEAAWAEYAKKQAGNPLHQLRSEEVELNGAGGRAGRTMGVRH